MGMNKGGSSETEVVYPEWWENAARENLKRANIAAQMGPSMMWTGPTVAAASPLSVGAWQSAGSMGDLAGLSVGAGQAAANYLPQAQQFAGGVRGYSSFPMIQQNMRTIDKMYPNLMDALYQLYPSLAPPGWEGTPYDWTGGLEDILAGETYWDAARAEEYGGETGSGQAADHGAGPSDPDSDQANVGIDPDAPEGPQ